ncbi:MAG: IS4 family transposase, partial [Methylococcaceae bacterium]
KTLPKEVHSLDEMIMLIASIGGFLCRKSDREPGAKSLWQGLEFVIQFAIYMQALKEAIIFV